MTWIPPLRRRVFLMRHGAVSYFDEAGKPFRPDSVPLTAEGRHQAEAARHALVDVPIDRAVSSNLPRTVSTAEIVTRERALEVEPLVTLREISPGRLADIPAEAVQESITAAFSGELSRDTRFLGGETFGELCDRVETAWQGLLADDAWRTLLIVAHGGVNRAILTAALGSGLAGFGRLEQDPACLNVIDVDEQGRALVRLLNYTPYNVVKIGLEMTSMEQVFMEYLLRRAD